MGQGRRILLAARILHPGGHPANHPTAHKHLLLADRAFDANWLREALSEAKIAAVIPPKSNCRFPAEFDKETYKWRHLIENFFQKIKEYRGIATRFCKTDTSYSALISLAATLLRLK